MRCRSRGMKRPRLASRCHPLAERGRRECRVLAATHGPPAEKKQAAVTTGPAGQPAFPARWLYALCVLSPGTGLSCPRDRRIIITTGVASASGCQDHTFSTCASSRSSARHQAMLRPQAPTTSHPACHDDRDTPLVPRWDGANKPYFLINGSRIFCARGLDRGDTLKPQKNFVFCRAAFTALHRPSQAVVGGPFGFTKPLFHEWRP